MKGATAGDVRAQSGGVRPPAAASPCAAGTARPAPGGPRPRAGAPAATGAANDARSVRPALRGRRFAGLASPGVPWSKVRLSSDESSGPPRMSSKNGSWQSSATVDRRSMAWNRHAIAQTPSSRRDQRDNVASMAWNRHAIAQMQLRKHVASMHLAP